MHSVQIRAALRAAAVAAGLIAAVGAQAQQIPGYPDRVDAFDPREVAMLPKYCTYTQLFTDSVPGGNDAQVRSSWYATMGPTFNHMHHYCFGLMKTNRAVLLSRDAVSRNFYLNDAIIEYDYVIRRAPPDFVLMPEMLTKKGQNLVLLGKGPMAVMEYRAAIEANAQYWPAYAYLSDYYAESGDLKQAREVLEEGIAKASDVTALQRRLDKLGKAGARKP